MTNEISQEHMLNVSEINLARERLPFIKTGTEKIKNKNIYLKHFSRYYR